MPKPNQSVKEFYSESEAAEQLGVSRTRLRMLLEEHVFNDGSECPKEVTLQACDLVLLRFWHQATPPRKLVRMPKQ